ncbi:ABC transporter substrate-binding protein [Nocardiopsis baichengensis]|uniref:ABC transporter substrate-binding protein n=1 Tax=Nocardiopsis baichengensis TaxID=280240 RepID=UPI00034AE914|nr:ABC transporter substrate-binding protein [Nocardiopsis baichengensis]
MRTDPIRAARPLAAASLALALLAAGCTGAGQTGEGAAADLDVSTGVTDDTVTIGAHMPLTGPAAPGYSQISVGAQAVYDFVNANGGVQGRSIEYLAEDDAYDPTRTVEVTRELVHDDEIFAMVGGLGTPTHSKVVDFLNTEGVPDLFPSSGALMWNDPEKYPLTYGYQVDYTKESKILGEHISEEFGDADVGYLMQNDDVGVDSQRGLDMYLQDQAVAVEHYESGAEDVSAQIANLEQEGAEVVVCACIPNYVALALLESARIGYEPQFVTSSIGGDTVTLRGLLSSFAEQAGSGGDPDDFLDGLLTLGYLPPVEMDDGDPWVEFFRGVYDEYGEDAPMSNTTVYGMVQAVLFVQALEAAGEDPTRASLIEALESQEGSGPGLVPFASTEDDRGGFSGGFITRYEAGEGLEMVRDPAVTDNAEGDVEDVEVDRPLPEDIGPLSQG